MIDQPAIATNSRHDATITIQATMLRIDSPNLRFELIMPITHSANTFT